MTEFDFKGSGTGSLAIKQLDLDSLAIHVPAIPPDAVGFYKLNCMVCMHRNGHSSGVKLRVENNTKSPATFEVLWGGDISDRILYAFRDTNKAVDFAACAIALILVCELTDLTAIEQSVVGTTIDYYLGSQDDADDVLIFNRKARLEVSGILTENEQNTVDDRVRTKLRRLDKKDSLPALIVVVEFGQPWSKLVQQ